MASAFYNQEALAQAAINLFHGWGYNFYRLENQLRADDQLVRSKATWLLGLARESTGAAETAYRREFFGTPTRDKPFPDAAVVENARKLERLGAAIGAIGGRLQAQPVPENDRMSQRYRREAPTLQRLIACDEQLVGRCALLQQMSEAKNGAWMLEHMAELEEGLAAIGQTLHEREAVLLDR